MCVLSSTRAAHDIFSRKARVFLLLLLFYGTAQTTHKVRMCIRWWWRGVQKKVSNFLQSTYWNRGRTSHLIEAVCTYGTWRTLGKVHKNPQRICRNSLLCCRAADEMRWKILDPSIHIQSVSLYVHTHKLTLLYFLYTFFFSTCLFRVAQHTISSVLMGRK